MYISNINSLEIRVHSETIRFNADETTRPLNNSMQINPPANGNCPMSPPAFGGPEDECTLS